MRADARRNYERLVATARKVFLEHGPEAPLDEIARLAQVGPGTLYRHFPSRVALMEAVYRSDITELTAHAYQLLEQYQAAEALDLWLRHFVYYVVNGHGLMAALKETIGKNHSVTAPIPKTQGTTEDINILLQLPGPVIHPLFIALGFAIFKQDGGRLYPLHNLRYRAVAIIYVHPAAPPAYKKKPVSLPKAAKKPVKKKLAKKIVKKTKTKSRGKKKK